MLFPRVFSEGTARKPYSSCSVLDLGYEHSLEPTASDFTVHPSDQIRSRNEAWERYLKPWEEGSVHVMARGKEFIVAAGYVSPSIVFERPVC